MPRVNIAANYIPQLDGLRGVAILSVMLFHAHVPRLSGGFVGVDMFFVLSGFLITSLLLAEADRYGSIDLKGFYIRRALRLVPAHVAFLIAFCLASSLFLNDWKARGNFVDAAISFFYISNWAKAFALHAPDYLSHTWSLAVEEQFYLIWPIALVWLLRSGRGSRSVVALATSVALLVWAWRVYLHADGASGPRLYNGLDTRADTLMIGCVLGAAFASGLGARPKVSPTLSRALAVAAPASALGLLAFSVHGSWGSSDMNRYGYIAIALLTAVLILESAIRGHGVVGRLLSAKPLVWIGGVSYGIYLWHYPIFRVLLDLQYGWAVVVTVGSLASVAAAALSYYWLERPLLGLKGRFARHRSAVGDAPPGNGIAARIAARDSARS